MNKQEILTAIRNKRKEMNILQDKMAELLGISRSQYSSLESGNSEITLDKLIKICEILNIELVGFKEVEKKNEEKQNLIQNIIDFANKLRDL
jgi:transcriptional regulator with XRE-family HTH domain